MMRVIGDVTTVTELQGGASSTGDVRATVAPQLKLGAFEPAEGHMFLPLREVSTLLTLMLQL